MLTHQEIYNKSLFGIRLQGKPSAVIGPTGRPMCKYRMPDPADPKRMLACGIGQVIPDDKYDPRWDRDGGINAMTLTRDYSTQMEAIGIPIDDSTRTLMQAIQSAHDGAAEYTVDLGDAAFIREFEFQMQDVAGRFAVTYTPAEA